MKIHWIQPLVVLTVTPCEPIGPLDTLIAGVVRDAGGTVVTRDDHFERVPELAVELLDSR